MHAHRLLIVVSALSLASLTIGTQAFAREAQPQDDRGPSAVIARDDRHGSPHIELGDDPGRDAQMEAPRGADDHAGDDAGVDAQPYD
jgi:hypothetical protein